MGYQWVDVRLKDGSKVEGVFVFNAEELESPSTRPVTSQRFSLAESVNLEDGHRQSLNYKMYPK